MALPLECGRPRLLLSLPCASPGLRCWAAFCPQHPQRSIPGETCHSLSLQTLQPLLPTEGPCNSPQTPGGSVPGSPSSALLPAPPSLCCPVCPPSGPRSCLPPAALNNFLPAPPSLWVGPDLTLIEHCDPRVLLTLHQTSPALSLLPPGRESSQPSGPQRIQQVCPETVKSVTLKTSAEGNEPIPPVT